LSVLALIDALVLFILWVLFMKDYPPVEEETIFYRAEALRKKF